MTASVGVLDFFIVEASDYIERLDNLIAASGPVGPNADSFGRYARALRGSATMSRQMGIAEVAGALERVARALRDRAVSWSPAVTAAAVAAVDDLRILVRAVRDWSPADDQRASTRAAELFRLAPGPGAPAVPTFAPPDSAATGTSYLASETADLARALEQLVATPDDTRAITELTGRVRALRGVADLRDMPPLPDVVDAVEHALKALELGAPTPSAKQQSLFATAAAVLRRAARDIAQRGRPVAGAPEVLAFHNAVAALPDEGGQADRIVPVADLFYDDAGPHLVSAAATPPTSAAERFRMEVVSLAEHLRRVVSEARANRGPESKEHTTRELRSALRALGSAANSFGERQVARFAAEWSAKVATLNDAGRTALDRAAQLLADPATRPEQLARALEQLAAPRSAQTTNRSTTSLLADDLPAEPPPPAAVRAMPPAAPAWNPPPVAPAAPMWSPAPAQPRAPYTGVDRRGLAAPVPQLPDAERRAPRPAPAPSPGPVFPAWPSSAAPPVSASRYPPSSSPSGDQLRAFLQDGISGLRRLEEQPLSTPAPLPDDDAVPIQDLLYRGRSALQRAAELRSEWQRAGAPPSPEAMQELFDLLDLALVE